MKTLTYAIRFLLRSKAYTLINLLGLAFSLACSIILIRYLHREWTVDTHCVDRERVVVPIRDIQVSTSLSNMAYCDSAYIPENQIVNRTKLNFYSNELVTYNEQDYYLDFIAADSNFLQMFHYPLVTGTAELSAPDHALITQECANRLFGKQNPVGKILTYNKQAFRSVESSPHLPAKLSSSSTCSSITRKKIIPSGQNCSKCCQAWIWKP